MLDVAYTQAGRNIEIATVLGTDVLLLEQFDIVEGLNDLFTLFASARAQRDDLQAADLVGSIADLSVQIGDGRTRYWNGFVTALHEGPSTSRGTRNYAITLRPRLWLLSQRSDCRIFLDQTSTQIAQTLCAEHGITALDLRVTSEPAAQGYSVQWNETDLAYLTRRLEEDGLFYWFEHAAGTHTLVVADHASGYSDGPGSVRYAQGSADQDHINDWRRSFSFTPGKRAGRDWNFETPRTVPTGFQSSFVSVPGNADHELYEYPGRFLDTSAGETMLRHRIEATEADFERVEGRSSVRTLAPGQTFTPYDVGRPSDTYETQVIARIRHTASNPSYETGAGLPSYENAFSVIPARVPATPHRETPRPRIVGSQIALIAGPAGEEIHTDQYGRVKLTFPWDRRAKGDGSDTCWVRVGQPWAGGTWGHQVIPRVGMEALVAYQDGDPDRPFVIALVPDPVNAVPYTLPDNKTRTVMRSNSYKSTGFNEMTFEDATGAENMFFHAQKDHTTKIQNNRTHSVGANHAGVVGQNQALTVGQNKTEEIGKSHNLIVGATGAGTAALMAPFAGMAGITSTMLSQALTTALTPDTGEAGPSQFEQALTGSVTAMMPGIASSLIGLLTEAGQQAQQGVWNGPSPRPDAGTALAGAGGLFGQAAGTLFNLPGMRNHITGTMKTDHVGCARVEQVGTSKVTHVGSTFGTKVGKTWSLTAGKDVLTRAGHDWAVGANNDANITAGKNVAIHAGQAVGIISDDSIFIAAKNGLTQSAKTIDLHATDSITFNVGDANSITINSDGTITLDAAKSIVLTAGDSIALKAGGASLQVGPGKVVSQPMVVEGNTDIAALVGIGVKNIAKDQFKLPGFVADALGYAAVKLGKIPWVGRQEQAVSDYFSPDKVEERRNDPLNQGLSDGFNWDSVQWPWK